MRTAPFQVDEHQLKVGRLNSTYVEPSESDWSHSEVSRAMQKRPASLEDIESHLELFSSPGIDLVPF